MKRLLIFLAAMILALPCCAAEQTASETAAYRPGDLVRVTFTVTGNPLSASASTQVTLHLNYDDWFLEPYGVVSVTGNGVRLKGILEKGAFFTNVFRAEAPDEPENTPSLEELFPNVSIYWAGEDSLPVELQIPENDSSPDPAIDDDFIVSISPSSISPAEDDDDSARSGSAGLNRHTFRVERTDGAGFSADEGSQADSSFVPELGPSESLIFLSPGVSNIMIENPGVLAVGDTLSMIFKVSPAALAGDWGVSMRQETGYYGSYYGDDDAAGNASSLSFSPAYVRIAQDVDSAPAIIVSGDGVRVTVDRGTVVTAAWNQYMSDYISQLYYNYGYYGLAPSVRSDASYLLDAIQQYERQAVMVHRAYALGLDDMSPEEQREVEAQAAEDYRGHLQSIARLNDPDCDPEDEAVLAQTEAQLLQMDPEAGSADGIRESCRSARVINLACRKLQDSILQDITVPEEEIRALYDQRIEESRQSFLNDPVGYEKDFVMASAADLPAFNGSYYYIPSSMRQIRYLMLRADQPDAGELARQVHEMAAAPDADFEALDQEYGDGLGGVVSVYEGCDLYVAEFQEAAMALSQPGEISEPVLAAGAYFILLYEEDWPEGPVPFSWVREALSGELLAEKQQEALQSALDQWITEVEIDVADDLEAVR